MLFNLVTYKRDERILSVLVNIVPYNRFDRYKFINIVNASSSSFLCIFYSGVLERILSCFLNNLCIK